jgi:hypothetical protein
MNNCEIPKDAGTEADPTEIETADAPERSAELAELRREIEELREADRLRMERESSAMHASPVSIDAAAGSGQRRDVLTPEKLARMKPAEIARLDWAEVRGVLANG